jgi:hypothetical protein
MRWRRPIAGDAATDHAEAIAELLAGERRGRVCTSVASGDHRSILSARCSGHRLRAFGCFDIAGTASPASDATAVPVCGWIVRLPNVELYGRAVTHAEAEPAALLRPGDRSVRPTDAHPIRDPCPVFRPGTNPDPGTDTGTYPNTDTDTDPGANADGIVRPDFRAMSNTTPAATPAPVLQPGRRPVPLTSRFKAWSSRSVHGMGASGARRQCPCCRGPDSGGSGWSARIRALARSSAASISRS